MTEVIDRHCRIQRDCGLRWQDQLSTKRIIDLRWSRLDEPDDDVDDGRDLELKSDESTEDARQCPMCEQGINCSLPKHLANEHTVQEALGD